jgi:hypothetical protein
MNSYVPSLRLLFCYICTLNVHVVCVCVYVCVSSVSILYQNAYPIYLGPEVFWAGHQWPMPIILATWKIEIWRIVSQDHPSQKIHETPPQPVLHHDWHMPVIPAMVGSLK